MTKTTLISAAEARRLQAQTERTSKEYNLLAEQVARAITKAAMNQLNSVEILLTSRKQRGLAEVIQDLKVLEYSTSIFGLLEDNIVLEIRWRAQ